VTAETREEGAHVWPHPWPWAGYYLIPSVSSCLLWFGYEASPKKVHALQAWSHWGSNEGSDLINGYICIFRTWWHCWELGPAGGSRSLQVCLGKHISSHTPSYLCFMVTIRCTDSIIMIFHKSVLQAQSNGSSCPWTETSKIVSQNKAVLYLNFFSWVFVTETTV
jgi:hypothetical protein